MNYLIQIWKSKDLRKKILFTLGIVLFFRILAQISIPGANLQAISLIFQRNELLGMFSLLTGGSAENFSIVLMGLSPYINASIIIQLLTVIIPKFDALSKEGDQGRRKLNQYTRWLTVPIAFLQSYGMIYLINAQSALPVIENMDNPAVLLPIMLTVTAGSVLLMWLGELITEKGIGNGVSVLIFAGIIATIPTMLGQAFTLSAEASEQMFPLVTMILVTLALTVLVILVTEAQRNIPITYAGRGWKTSKGVQSNLPIRINQAGMIPIIFAVSVISFPTFLGNLFLNSENESLRNMATFITTYFNQDSWLYLLLYFLLVVAFTFFYVSITFNPQQVAENVQKRGGYIPGIRPGKETADYIDKISHRLNLFGGIFIGFIGISPMLLTALFRNFNLGSVPPTIITGSGLIIVVGVVLEILRQINAQLVMHDYNKLY